MARSSNTYSYASNLDNTIDVVALTLFWAEGSKFRKHVEITNSDPEAIRIFSKFLLERCHVSKKKLKGRLQIHDKNNVKKAITYWSKISGVPKNSIIVSIRKNKKSNRTNKHPNGIFSIRYNSVGLHEILRIVVETQIKYLNF